MSLECSECEHDARGEHAEDCSRYRRLVSEYGETENIERNPPAAPDLATLASDQPQVGTTGRLDAKTAQTGAEGGNERNEK